MSSVRELCNIDAAFKWIGDDEELCKRIKIEAVYDYVLKDQQKEVEEIRRDEELLIPKEIDYLSKSLSLSFEERDKLISIQPQTIASATRIQGITPSTIVRLLRYVKKNNQEIIKD